MILQRYHCSLNACHEYIINYFEIVNKKNKGGEVKVEYIILYCMQHNEFLITFNIQFLLPTLSTQGVWIWIISTLHQKRPVRPLYIEQIHKIWPWHKPRELWSYQETFKRKLSNWWTKMHFRSQLFPLHGNHEQQTRSILTIVTAI